MQSREIKKIVLITNEIQFIYILLTHKLIHKVFL